MADQQELAVVLKLVADQFKSELKNSQGLLGDFNKFISDWKTQLSAASGALLAIAKSTANYGEELVKASQKTGIAVESLAGLQYAAKLSDLTNEQLVTSLIKLSKNLQDTALGTGDAQQAFRALGIAITGSNGQLRPTGDVLGDIAAKFASFQDGPAKAALAVRLFGRSGADLIPFLNNGRDGLKELQAEAEKFGLVMSDKDARAANEFNDNLKRLTASMTGMKNELGAALIPGLNDLLDTILKLKGPGGDSLLGSIFKAAGMQLVAFNVLVREVIANLVAVRDLARAALPGATLSPPNPAVLPGAALRGADLSKEDRAMLEKLGMAPIATKPASVDDILAKLKAEVDAAEKAGSKRLFDLNHPLAAAALSRQEQDDKKAGQKPPPIVTDPEAQAKALEAQKKTRLQAAQDLLAIQQSELKTSAALNDQQFAQREIDEQSYLNVKQNLADIGVAMQERAAMAELAILQDVKTKRFAIGFKSKEEQSEFESKYTEEVGKTTAKLRVLTGQQTADAIKADTEKTQKTEQLEQQRGQAIQQNLSAIFAINQDFQNKDLDGEIRLTQAKLALIQQLGDAYGGYLTTRETELRATLAKMAQEEDSGDAAVQAQRAQRMRDLNAELKQIEADRGKASYSRESDTKALLALLEQRKALKALETVPGTEKSEAAIRAEGDAKTLAARSQGRTKELQDIATLATAQVAADDANLASYEQLSRDRLAALQAELEARLSQEGLTENQITAIKLEGYAKIAREQRRINAPVTEGLLEGLQSYVYNSQNLFSLSVDMARQTAQAMSQGFQQFFFDYFQGKITSLKDAMTSLVTFVRQIMSQVLAAMATSSIVTPLASGLPGLLGGLLGSPSTSMTTPSSTVGPLVTAPSLNHGGMLMRRYAFGGNVLPFTNGDSVPAMLTPGEFVVPASRVPALERFIQGQTANEGMGGNVQVNVYNAPAGTSAKVDTRRDKRDMIVDVVLQDLQHGGPIRNAMKAA